MCSVHKTQLGNFLFSWLHTRCGISEKLTGSENVDFYCNGCLEGGPDQHVPLEEVEIEPNVKLES